MNCFALQTDEFPALEEGDDGAASQSVAMDQEVTLSQSDAADQLEQEVIVIVTDTESENDQEDEEEEEGEEQVIVIPPLGMRRLKRCCSTDVNACSV